MRMLTLYFVVAIVGLFSSAAFSADIIDTNAAKLRAEKAKESFVCSPSGTELGSVTPNELMKKIKRGASVKFLPGIYPGIIEFTVDNLIIEGEPNQFVLASIRSKGKGTIVRNLWINTLSFGKDAFIVDSACNSIDLSIDCNSPANLKPKSLVYNVATRTILVSGPWDIDLKYAAVVFHPDRVGNAAGQTANALYYDYNANISASNSIFYSFDNTFCQNWTSDGQPNGQLKLKDCLIGAGLSLGRADGMATNRNQAHTLKDLKRNIKLTIVGNTQETKLEFQKPEMSQYIAPDSTPSDILCLNLENFTLKDLALAKKLDAGVKNVASFPVRPGQALAKDKEPAAPPPAQPPAAPENKPVAENTTPIEKPQDPATAAPVEIKTDFTPSAPMQPLSPQ